MQEQKENIITHAMRSGLMLGGGFSILTVIQWMLSNGSPFISYIVSIASIFYIFYCIFRYTAHYSQTVLDGKITYFSAYKYGIYMFFFAAMILAVVTFCYFKLNGDALTEMIDSVIVIVDQMPESESTQQLRREISQHTPNSMAMTMMSGFCFLGLFICLFTSISTGIFDQKVKKRINRQK